MKVLRFALGLAAAAVLHTLGSRWIPGFAAAIDLFLVLAVNCSLSSSAGWSAVAGSTAGLARDALSGGLYGLHGFADTLVAYLSARIQQRLLIKKPLQVGTLFAGAAGAQLLILEGLRLVVLPSGGEIPGIGALVVRMLVCGLLGLLLFVLSARLGSALERRRERRRRRLTMAI